MDRENFEAPEAAPRAGLRLEYDVCERGPAQSVVVTSPTLRDVVAALSSLDQSRHTEMTVTDDSGAYVTVGGGRGSYHVYIGAVDHEDCVILQRPVGHGAAVDTVELVMDGRMRRYAGHDVVDLQTALIVVEEFMNRGRPHPGLLWRTG